MRRAGRTEVSAPHKRLPLSVRAALIVFLLVLQFGVGQCLSIVPESCTLCGVGSGLLIGAQSGTDPLKEHFTAAQAALRADDLGRAASEYKAFLKDALHLAANARARGGDRAASVTTFQDALSFDGDDPALQLDYASVLFDLNRSAEARAIAQGVADRDPKNSRAQVVLGRAAYELKDYAAAKEHLERAAGQGELKEVWQLLGISYLRLQQLENAQSLMRKVLAEAGDTPQNRLAVATTYYYGDYPDQAAAALKKLIAENPAAPDAHYYLGLAYLGHNEAAGYDKAIPEFRAQLKIDPKDFRSRYMLGYIALQQRNFSEAESELRQAAKLNPEDQGTQLSLADVYSSTGRDPQAEEVLRGLIAARGKDVAPDYVLVRAHYMLGRILQQRSAADEAASEIRISEQLRKQLRLNAAEISQGRERSAADSGGAMHHGPGVASAADREGAEAFLRQISPAIGEAYYNLGAILAREKDSAGAAQYLKKAGEWDSSLRKP